MPREHPTRPPLIHSFTIHKFTNSQLYEPHTQRQNRPPPLAPPRTSQPPPRRRPYRQIHRGLVKCSPRSPNHSCRTIPRPAHPRPKRLQMAQVRLSSLAPPPRSTGHVCGTEPDCYRALAHPNRYLDLHPIPDHHPSVRPKQQRGQTHLRPLAQPPARPSPRLPGRPIRRPFEAATRAPRTIPRQNCGVRHPCLPWSWASQPGGSRPGIANRLTLRPGPATFPGGAGILACGFTRLSSPVFPPRRISGATILHRSYESHRSHPIKFHRYPQ